MSMEYIKLKEVATFPTGKLNSNAAIENGEYPFFTCSHDIYTIDWYSYDGEYILLGGNNANGDFPIFYYNGKFNAYQRTYLIQPKKPKEYSTKYLFYAISLRLLQMKGNAAGTATKFLTQPILNNIYIEKRDYQTQQKIASILSAYDNLIEVNNKRIKVLEQMAENLYKEWFVRFRFPGHESAEFENGIPKGWKYQKLEKLLDVRYGKEHKNVGDGDIPIFGSGGLMRFGDKALYNGEVVLIPRKGSLNNIMYYNVPFWTVDTMFYAVPLIPNIAKYAYYLLSNVDMESYNTGAALPSMTTDILYHFKILVPDGKVLMAFDRFISDIFAQKQSIQRVNENLIKQRDLLLPRLMSGKLEVNK